VLMFVLGNISCNMVRLRIRLVSMSGTTKELALTKLSEMNISHGKKHCRSGLTLSSSMLD
jgi:hypothetical protein